MRGHDGATAGGMALLAVAFAVVVVGAVGVVGSGSGHGAGVGDVADGAASAAAQARSDQARGDSGGVGTAAVVTLGEGETAWEALRPHAPDGIRYEVFVHEVMRANDVDARELRPGDVVVVPGEVR